MIRHERDNLRGDLTSRTDEIGLVFSAGVICYDDYFSGSDVGDDFLYGMKVDFAHDLKWWLGWECASIFEKNQ